MKFDYDKSEKLDDYKMYHNLEEKLNVDPDARKLFWLGIFTGATIGGCVFLLLFSLLGLRI